MYIATDHAAVHDAIINGLVSANTPIRVGLNLYNNCIDFALKEQEKDLFITVCTMYGYNDITDCIDYSRCHSYNSDFILSLDTHHTFLNGYIDYLSKKQHHHQTHYFTRTLIKKCIAQDPCQLLIDRNILFKLVFINCNDTDILILHLVEHDMCNECLNDQDDNKNTALSMLLKRGSRILRSGPLHYCDTSGFEIASRIAFAMIERGYDISNGNLLESICKYTCCGCYLYVPLVRYLIRNGAPYDYDEIKILLQSKRCYSDDDGSDRFVLLRLFVADCVMCDIFIPFELCELIAEYTVDDD